jgi:hypothetical protein
LTAYHEHTNQKRAVINLSKASRLVDDKTTLVANPSPSKSGKARRKSAFAEEDEGYAYVEEGFRIRFGNGETIDFYADSRHHKDQWMEVLAKVVGKADQGSKKMGWTDLVLAREKAGGVQTDGGASPTKSMDGTDVKDFSPRPAAPPAVAPQPAPDRMNSVTRKPVAGSKSVPNSPVKGGQRIPQSKAEAARPKTPPMKPRTGHRSRDAVKSMIF